MNSKEPRLPMSTGLGLQATHRNTCGWKRKIELTRTIGNGPVDDKPLKRVPCAPAWLALPQIGWARRSLAPSNRNEYKHHCWLHLEPGPVKHASQMRKPWRLSRHGCPSPGLPCPWAQTKPRHPAVRRKNDEEPDSNDIGSNLGRSSRDSARWHNGVELVKHIRVVQPGLALPLRYFNRLSVGSTLHRVVCLCVVACRHRPGLR